MPECSGRRWCSPRQVSRWLDRELRSPRRDPGSPGARSTGRRAPEQSRSLAPAWRCRRWLPRHSGAWRAGGRTAPTVTPETRAHHHHGHRAQRPTRDLVDNHRPWLELARDQHLALGQPQRLEKEPLDKPGILGRMYDEQPYVGGRGRPMRLGGRGRRAQAQLSLHHAFRRHNLRKPTKMNRPATWSQPAAGTSRSMRRGPGA